MARQKILLTGGSGLLAVNWACALREHHDIVLGTHMKRVQLAGTRALQLPLEDLQALREEVAALRPDVIVHAAGITSVEDCERDPALAHHVYVDLSRNIASCAAEAGSAFIHISTDHLFPGTHALYSESEPAEPINVYGRVKLEAERIVASTAPQALVVRTNFFGWGHRYRQSFSDWVYYKLAAGEEITMFDDVFITPVLADVLATTAHALLDTGAIGVWNVCGDERVSKYEFGVRLAEAFGLPASQVQRGKIGASHLSAKRPRDMSLSNKRARERLGTALGRLSDYFGVLRQQDDAGRRRELLAAVSE